MKSLAPVGGDPLHANCPDLACLPVGLLVVRPRPHVRRAYIPNPPNHSQVDTVFHILKDAPLSDAQVRASKPLTDDELREQRRRREREADATAAEEDDEGNPTKPSAAGNRRQGRCHSRSRSPPPRPAAVSSSAMSRGAGPRRAMALTPRVCTPAPSSLLSLLSPRSQSLHRLASRSSSQSPGPPVCPSVFVPVGLKSQCGAQSIPSHSCLEA